MAFTKITAAGIGSTETVTLDGLSVVNNGSFGGNLTVSGVLTYEDVTNVDSVGLITARNGIVVGSGITLSKDGDGFFTGVVTATSFSGSGSGLTGVANTDVIFTDKITLPDSAAGSINVGLASDLQIFHNGSQSKIIDTQGNELRLNADTIRFRDKDDSDTYANFIHDGAVELYHDNSKKLETASGGVTVTGTVSATSVTASGIDLSGLLREGVNITAGKLSDNTNIDLEDGMVHLFTTQETTTSTPNIRFSSSTSLNNSMNTGEAISVTIITTAAAGGYSAQLTIDGSAVTENWVGGSAPSAGGSSGVDIYSYTIIKTASATFTVIGNLSKTS